MTLTPDQLQANFKSQQLKDIALGSSFTKFKTLINSILANANDSWNDLGAMSNGWTADIAHYKHIGIASLVMVEIQNMVPGSTKTDASQLWSAANGFPGGYRPAQNRRIPVAATSSIGSEIPSIQFQTDGTVQCFGFGATSIGRADGNFIFSTI